MLNWKKRSIRIRPEDWEGARWGSKQLNLVESDVFIFKALFVLLLKVWPSSFFGFLPISPDRDLIFLLGLKGAWKTAYWGSVYSSHSSLPAGSLEPSICAVTVSMDTSDVSCLYLEIRQRLLRPESQGNMLLLSSDSGGIFSICLHAKPSFSPTANWILQDLAKLCYCWSVTKPTFCHSLICSVVVRGHKLVPQRQLKEKKASTLLEPSMPCCTSRRHLSVSGSDLFSTKPCSCFLSSSSSHLLPTE